MTTVRLLARAYLTSVASHAVACVLAVAVVVLGSPFLVASAPDVPSGSLLPTVSGWPAGCYAADLGDYDAVMVGGTTPERARRVWTGRRLADDDPRWRQWRTLWATCKEGS